MAEDVKAPPVDAPGEASEPLYRRVSRELKKDIISGVYPVGSLLPTEQELCDLFGASRYTVREALRLLGEDGMLERRQGRGSEVISSHERRIFVQSLTSLTQLYDYASETLLMIDRILRIVPDEELAIQLGRAPGREWLLAEGIRKTTEGETICVSRVFIHKDFAEIGSDLKGHKGAIHTLIESRFGVKVMEVHQEITAGKLDASMAAILGETAGADAIVVTRRYLASDDRPVIVSLNWHRLHAFSYRQIIRRE